MKPLKRNNYGSIPHLSNSKLGSGDHYINKGQERILTEKTRDEYDTILIFEKYDGSNVGVTKVNGQIYPLIRSGYNAITSPYTQHQLFAKWVRSREKLFQNLLQEGERITGEWLVQAHRLLYKIETEPIVFFDYFTSKNQRLIYKDLKEKAIQYNLQLPRLLHQGSPVKVEELLPILNQKTPEIESIDLPEGMIYRVERKNKVDFLAKWVRSDFENGKYCINVDEKDLIWNYDKRRIL